MVVAANIHHGSCDPPYFPRQLIDFSGTLNEDHTGISLDFGCGSCQRALQETVSHMRLPARKDPRNLAGESRMLLQWFILAMVR